MSHEPLAYIRGRQEFYGRDFRVSPDTLTPRPETETMLELLFQIIKSDKFSHYIQPDTNNQPLTAHPSPITVLDVGTGSGCIIITAALELVQISNIKYQISFIGLDISGKALKIAKLNANNLKVRVKFNQFDLLKDDFSSILNPQSSICILANLPYVPDDFHINLAASHEPGFAIFGGKDGLDYYRLLFKKATKKTGLIFTESLPPQHSELIEIAKEAGYKLVLNQDLIHVFSK
jgi:release factor glutamine methyltransferase